MHPDNKAIYDANWEDWSDQKLYGPASRWLRWLVDQNLGYVDATRIREIIDVGCGQGAMTSMLATLLPAARVLGIDFSETGIAIANTSYALPNLSFSLDINSVHLDQMTYDLVTCFEVLEHVDDWQSLLQRMCRASRRYVLLSYPTGRMRKFESTVGHVRNFRRGEVEDFMDRADFIPRNLFYAGFPFYSPLYRDFCNLMDAGNSSFASGQFGFSQKLVSRIFFVLFRRLSLTRIGDQFCGVFERK